MWFWAFLALLLCHHGEAGNTIDCIQNTGGGCATADCFPWRGPTRCDLTRCFCTEGTCAGGDGICTSEPYGWPGNASAPPVYSIRNARWPEYYIDVDWTGSVDFEKGSEDDDRKFNLSMPSYAGGDEPLRQPIFIIASVRWPDAALRVIEELDDAGQRKYSAKCHNVHGALGGLGADPSVAAVAMILTTAPVPGPEGDYPLMLSSAQYPNQYLYVPKMGLSVKVNQNDPGAGGYWYFEPRLPEDLRAKLLRYSGPRCSSFCGEVAPTETNAAALGGVSMRLLVVIALAFSSVLSLLAS